ncbi:hypothetical protein BpHYR1_035122 [Brachionus plicatilis]|uniref:Uncharacterized protein n=1 Tax=Brachionus plicatilis TaxID=10195 RepID=A0A3M7RJS2_BRAPC|nr:hypothetical protein BpHYR1_035122 [Brachionus plicatilis]
MSAKEISRESRLPNATRSHQNYFACVSDLCKKNLKIVHLLVENHIFIKLDFMVFAAYFLAPFSRVKIKLKNSKKSAIKYCSSGQIYLNSDHVNILQLTLVVFDFKKVHCLICCPIDEEVVSLLTKRHDLTPLCQIMCRFDQKI